jgi:hypothetical protein
MIADMVDAPIEFRGNTLVAVAHGRHAFIVVD